MPSILANSVECGKQVGNFVRNMIMKILLVFLIIANIIVAFHFYFLSPERKEFIVPLLHPEKIILLSAKE